MKIHQVAAELFHALGGTDMTKLIVALRNFANEPKKNRKNTTGFVQFHCDYHTQ